MMGYYKSRHSSERFSSPLRQFLWASWGGGGYDTILAKRSQGKQ